MTKYDATLSQTFAALADPTRRRILAQLAHGPAALVDLAAPTGFALPTVLRHVTILESAGLIRSQKIGRSRICHAATNSLDHGLDWMTKTRHSLQSQTDRLEIYAKSIMPIQE
jgi:DNA-binding transcriptional ArsR family regulator